MFDYEKIRNEVENYLGSFVEDYDVDAIMDDLMGYCWHYLSSIDDVDYDEFINIIESHEK